MNAQDYINDKYDGEDPTWLKAWLDNTGYTIKSQYAFFAPWDTALSSDREWLDNARSGAVLGLFNVGNIASTGARVYGATKQYKADNWLANHAETDLLTAKDDLTKGRYYADMAGKGLSTQVFRAFETAKNIGIEGIDAEMWDQEEKRAIRIMNFATDDTYKKLADQRGYKPGTEDYNTYIALLDYVNESTKGANAQVKDHNKNIAELINNVQLQEDMVIGHMFDPDESNWDKNAYKLIDIARIAGKMTAQRQAYEQVISELSQADGDLHELKSRFGINYNKKDLDKVRKQIADAKKKFDEKDAKFKEALEDTPLIDWKTYNFMGIHNDLVRAYKTSIYLEADLERIKADAAALTGTDEKSIEATRKMIDRYNKAQEDNLQLEQDIEDNYRHVEEKEEAVPVETTDERTPEVAPTIEQTSIEEVATEPIPVITIGPEAKPEPKTTEAEETPSTPQPKEDVQPIEEEQPTEGTGSEPSLDSADKVAADIIKSETDELRKQVLDARKPIAEIKVEKAGRSKSKIARMRNQYGYSPEQFSDEDLDQQNTTVWNPDNTFGKAYLDAEKSRNDALTEITQELQDIVTTAYSGNAWKYNGERKPFFMMQDVEEVLNIADQDISDEEVARRNAEIEAYNATAEEKIAPFVVQGEVAYNTLDQYGNQVTSVYAIDLPGAKAKITTPLVNLLQSIYDLNEVMGVYEEAISNADIISDDSYIGIVRALGEIKDAESQLKSSLDAYLKSKQREEEKQVDVSTLDTFKEKGHKAYSMTSEARQVTANGDFVVGSNFTIDIINGKPHLIAEYKGKTYQLPIENDAQTTAIIAKIEAYKQQQKKNPVLEIVPVGLERTNGVPVNGKARSLMQSSFWEVGQDPYLIDSSNTELLIGTGDAYGNQVTSGTDSYSQRSTSMGGIYWKTRKFHPETGKYKDLRFKLVNAKLGDFDGLADTVIDLFLHRNEPQYTNKEGIKTPFPAQTLLDFIVFNGAKTAMTEDRKAQYKPEEFAARQQKQLYLAQDGKLVIGTQAFDLTDLASNEAVRKQAVELLNTFNFRIAKDNIG